MGASSSKPSKKKSTASSTDASSVEDPIKPEKEVIIDMETFSTIYCAKIKGYSQLKHGANMFRIDCGMFHLAGYWWSVDYYPRRSDNSTDNVALQIRLASDTINSLKLDVQISLIDPTGRRLVVTNKNQTYYRKHDGSPIKLMRKKKLDSSKYVKDDCLSIECLVTVRKWSRLKR